MAIRLQKNYGGTDCTRACHRTANFLQDGCALSNIDTQSGLMQNTVKKKNRSCYEITGHRSRETFEDTSGKDVVTAES